MRALVSVALATLCATLAAQQRRTPPEKPDERIELPFTAGSEHWRVRTNVDEKTARRYLKILEGVLAQLEKTYMPLEGRWKRIDVLVYARRAQMEREWKVRKSAGGMYTGRHIVCYHGIFSVTGSTVQVLAHEGTHAYQDALLGGLRNLPVWLLEGMAVASESVKVDRAGNVSFGTPFRERVLHVQHDIDKHQFLSLRTLVSTPAGAFAARHYAYAGLLVFFMLKGGDASLRKALLDCLETARAGRLDAETLQKHLKARTGADLSALEKRFKRWAKGRRVPYSGRAVGTHYTSRVMGFDTRAPGKKWRINVSSLLARSEYVVYWRTAPFARFSVWAVANSYASDTDEAADDRARRLREAGIEVNRSRTTLARKDAVVLEFECRDEEVMRDGKTYRVREVWLATEKAVLRLRFQASPSDWGDVVEDMERAFDRFRLLGG